ncbi:MAG TPA: hypothetical protein VH164_11530, partial [Ktedonobacteraceae bacterium]|nr:hypothetical protein [Ktedonobacteraceae bacterium]
VEELSVHWLRFTVTWIGPLANRPDVCFIWRQRGKRLEDLQEWEDNVIKELYPTGERLDLLRALPDRTFNVMVSTSLLKKSECCET